MSVNPIAHKDGRTVTLEEVGRKDKGLTCPTCGGRLVVKDGRGQFVASEGPRHRAKGKHFAHAANSGCHGEGPAHFLVKKALCEAINLALKMPEGERNSRGRISYRCPDPVYGPKDIIKFAPGSGGLHQEFEQMKRGFHQYDLLHCSTRAAWSAPVLDHAECEVWLDGRRTRADIAGLDRDRNVLWVIEIQRSGLSQAAIDHALEKGIPLFVVDLTHLPQPSANDQLAETESFDFYILAENLAMGHFPCANVSFNTECDRKAIGMGPDDHSWSRWCIYVHKGSADCDYDGCPECEEVVLHQCSGLLCPDTTYMIEQGIDHLTMYTEPFHRAHSHIP